MSSYELVLGLKESIQNVSQFIMRDEDVISSGQSVFPGSAFSLKDKMGMDGVALFCWKIGLISHHPLAFRKKCGEE